MARSPTKRTLARLRGAGYTAAVVERWNAHAGRRQDLWGFDILAVRGDKAGVLGLQVTARSGHAARRKKLLAYPVLKTWLVAGNRAAVESWRKKGDRWECWTEDITLQMLERNDESYRRTAPLARRSRRPA